jgi:hypothetical protein
MWGETRCEWINKQNRREWENETMMSVNVSVRYLWREDQSIQSCNFCKWIEWCIWRAFQHKRLILKWFDSLMKIRARTSYSHPTKKEENKSVLIFAWNVIFLFEIDYLRVLEWRKVVRWELKEAIPSNTQNTTKLSISIWDEQQIEREWEREREREEKKERNTYFTNDCSHLLKRYKQSKWI